MMLFRKSKPAPKLTDQQIRSAAARYLAKSSALTRAMIRIRCAELREGGPSPIADRDSVVAPVRALREVRGHG